MIWSKEDSYNLKLLAKNSTIIAKSLAKIAQLDDVEILESRPLSGPIGKIIHKEYNPEAEFEEEQEEILEKRNKLQENSEQLWIEDEMDLEDLE